VVNGNVLFVLAKLISQHFSKVVVVLLLYVHGCLLCIWRTLFPDSNLFNQDIVNTLKEIGDDKQRCGYILMDKIRPTATRNYIVASGKATPARVLGEPGIYGGFLAYVRLAKYCLLDKKCNAKVL